MAKVVYTSSDHLTSTRITTDGTGNVLARHDYQPYGEEIYRTSYGGDSVRRKFTTYERDAESDLDFAAARFYNFRLGRFASADPLLASSKVNAPSTWNRYTYALNNPCVLRDPTGLWVWSDELGGMKDEQELRTAYGDEKAKEIMGKRRIFLNGIQKARELLNSNKLNEQQKKLIQRALNAYGTEQVGKDAKDDKIRVEYGYRRDAGQVDTNYGSGQVVVKINELSRDIIDTIAHEGSHVADDLDFMASNCVSGSCSSGGANDITSYETERRAYTVSSLIAQAQGLEVYPSRQQ